MKDETEASTMHAETKHGSTLRTWDEGFEDSPLFLYLESLGPVGVVRAETWETTYDCVVDEIMDDADPADPDTYATSYDPDADPGDLAEGCHYRSNGIPSNPDLHSPIAREDLNGSQLVQVTPEQLRDEYGIRVAFYDPDDVGSVCKRCAPGRHIP